MRTVNGALLESVRYIRTVPALHGIDIFVVPVAVENEYLTLCARSAPIMSISVLQPVIIAFTRFCVIMITFFPSFLFPCHYKPPGRNGPARAGLHCQALFFSASAVVTASIVFDVVVFPYVSFISGKSLYNAIVSRRLDVVVFIMTV